MKAIITNVKQVNKKSDGSPLVVIDVILENGTSKTLFKKPDEYAKYALTSANITNLKEVFETVETVDISFNERGNAIEISA